MAARRVVISGLGPVTAAGIGPASLADALAAGVPLFSEVDRFEMGDQEPRWAAQVRGFKARDWLPAALVRQTDLSTHFAFAAVRVALEDAGLELPEIDPLRIGILVGHGLGGMVFAEPELYNQWVLGPHEVSTYQSIAWFYAAAMGQVSIALGLRGYSKCFVADRASGMHALGHAFRVVQSGRLDVCLAGGTEAPLSPFIYRALASTGHLARERYRPFSAAAEGCLIGEGACFLVLEELAHARERGAPVYCEVLGYGMATDCQAGACGLAQSADLARALRLALAEGGKGSQPGAVLADGAGLPAADAAEAAALRAVAGDGWDGAVSVAKSVVGEMYGGGAPVQAAAAALAIARQTVWPLAGGEEAAVPHLRQAVRRHLPQVLVNSRGMGGAAAALLLGRPSTLDKSH